MKCSNCGEEVSDGIKFCPNCGENLEKPKCPDCGHEVSDAVAFCPNCGCDLKSSACEGGVSDQEVNASNKENEGRIVLTNADSESNSSQNTGVKNQKKSLSDIPEDFKNASTGKKILAVILCCCIGLSLFGVIGGLLIPDSNTDGSYADYVDNVGALSSGSSSGLDDQIGDAAVQIKVTCDGQWHGSVAVESTTESYSGYGDKIINVDADSSDIVGVAFQKEDSGNGKLKVELIKNGKVVEEESTTDDYGVVSMAD